MSTELTDRLDRIAATAEEARADEGVTHVGLSVEDVEELLRIAGLARRAGHETRREMRKGAPGSFRADFPASAALADLFRQEQPA